MDSSFPFAGGIAYQFGTLMPFRGGGVHTIGIGSKAEVKMSGIIMIRIQSVRRVSVLAVLPACCDGANMLTRIYMEALLVDQELADQVWEAWDKGEIDGEIAVLMWWSIAQPYANCWFRFFYYTS